MAVAIGFPPVADVGVNTLVLGSMPGVESLRRQQYYAHPRNAFWGIVGRLFGLPGDADYAQRTRALLAAHIALWDVLATCERAGSLDSAIDDASIVVNDFSAFFARCPGITRVFFNGARAEAEFMRRVAPSLPAALQLQQRLRLPSTSPALASLSFEQKLQAWSPLRSDAPDLPSIGHGSSGA